MEIRRLNCLRGIAAMIVVLSHFSNVMGWLGGMLGDRAGQLGVMLFFLLSGFLMSHLYLDRRFCLQEFRRYAVARVARVFPLFLLVVVLSYLLDKAGVTGVLYPVSGEPLLLSHLLFLYGVEVLWTIPPEIHFYGFFVLLWWLAAHRGALLYWVIGGLIVLLFAVGPVRPRGDALGIPHDIVIFNTLAYFLTGVVLGRGYRRWSVPTRRAAHLWLLSLLCIPLLYPQIFRLVTGVDHGMWQDIRVLLVMAAVFFALVYLVPEGNRLLENRVGDFLGRISYSLYLLHLPVLWQVEKLPIANTELRLVLFVGLTLLVCQLSYRFVELPASRLVRKLGAGRPLAACRA